MRLIKNVKANWWDHVINLVVVFLGVTIAFQMGNWKENRALRNMEKEFCKSMITDLENDLATLKYCIDTIPTHIDHYNKILGSTYSNTYRNDSSLIKSIFVLYSQVYFLPHHVTYRSYNNAGKLDIIKDHDLKRNMTLYYEIYSGFIEKMEDAVKDYRNQQFLPYIMKNIRYSDTYTLADFEFLEDTYFINLLIGRTHLEQGQLYAYKEAEQSARRLKAHLEAYLNNEPFEYEEEKGLSLELE